MAYPRRLKRHVETRASWTRVSDPEANLGFRWNSPDGFVSSFLSPNGAGNTSWGGWPVGETPLGNGAWNGSDHILPSDGRWPHGWVLPQQIGPNTDFSFTHDSGMMLAAIDRCRALIAETIVRIRWLWLADGEIVDRPLWADDPMLQGTAPGTLWGVLPSGLRVDGHSFFVRFLWQAVLFGQSPMVYEPNREGHPKAGTLRLLEPFAVKRNRAGRWVILAEREQDRIEVDHDGYFYLENGVQLRLVVLTGPGDGAGPDGVLVRHWRTFRLAANVRDYIAGAFDGAGIPSGFLTVKTPNFSQDKADELKKKWNEAHGGQRRGIAVLNAMVDYSPVSVSPVDTDAAAMSTVSLRDIAHAFGLDPSWLGAQIGGSSLTYRNVAEVRRDLVDAVLAPWSERLMSVLQSCMPITHRVRVDWSDYVSPSWQEMLPLVVSGVQAGVMTHVEARRKLGFDPGVGPDPNFDSWLAEREGNAGNPII